MRGGPNTLNHSSKCKSVIFFARVLSSGAFDYLQLTFDFNLWEDGDGHINHISQSMVIFFLVRLSIKKIASDFGLC